MPNNEQLWEDMKRLNDVMEELLWDPDDEIIFSHNGTDIICLLYTSPSPRDQA